MIPFHLFIQVQNNKWKVTTLCQQEKINVLKIASEFPCLIISRRILIGLLFLIV